MKLIRLLTRRMVAKVFLVVGLVIGAALLLQARADGRRVERTLKAETRMAAEQMAQLVIRAVEHAMLAGDGIKVRNMVADFKREVPGVQIQIFDRTGVEVFAAKQPAPAAESLPAPLRAALAGRDTRSAGRILQPIEAEERCADCHDDDRAVRGVIDIRVDETACTPRRDELLAELANHGFVQLMTAKRDELLDDYFAELATHVPGIRGVGVYDHEGDHSFGAELPHAEAAVRQALNPGAEPRTVAVADGDGVIAVRPQVMKSRCLVCHDDELGATRGVLAVELAAAPGDCGAQIVGAVDRSLRFIMLSALGRRVADFLDGAVAAGAAQRIDVYDPDGRSQWTTEHPPPPPEIGRVLATGTGLAGFVGSGDDERVRVVEPMANDDGCRRCHGDDGDLRGAVSVLLSTAAAARERQVIMHESTWFTGYTLAGVLVLLIGLLQYLVARPVNRIGSVADEIGRGNLDVAVDRAHPDGDEVARLGLRINEMIRDLRAKLHLEKLVSRGAAEAAAGGLDRAGELRRFTVLFSDIRGFTAYSEDRDPAEVVAMLNQLLGEQAEIVSRHGGDIDKFIGDELMALFAGPDAEHRAIACALELIGCVGADRLAIGVGVHCGDVVYGAIGHEDRMDFTVIGDVVNTAARLCSAADGGQILVTRQVQEVCADLPAVEFAELEPITVKGKRQPLEVRCVRPSASSDAC